jgi:hypothetical protein
MFSVRRVLHGLVSVVSWILMASFGHSVHQQELSAMLTVSEVFVLLLVFVFIPSTRQKMILVSKMYDLVYSVFIFFNVLKLFLGNNETIKYVFDLFPPSNIYAVHLFVVISLCSNFVLAERFPSKIFDDGDCAVCMSPHVNPSRPTCGHTFCYECLISWCRTRIAFAFAITCPICSQVFTILQRTSDDDGQTRIITVNTELFLVDDMPFFDFGMTTLTLELIGDFFFMFLSSFNPHIGFMRLYMITSV